MSLAIMALVMTIAETLAVFIGIPAAVIALVALLVYGPSRARRAQRYRPGVVMGFRPMWLLAPSAKQHGHARLQRPTLPAEASEVGKSVGGARASW
jgi:hypothetical protein